jgi:hypothetical protein
MKRFSTLAIAAIGLMAVSIPSFAQTCTMSTSAPAQPFTYNQAVSASTGFTGSGQSTVGTYPNGKTSTLISPVFFNGTAGSSITFGVHLAAAQNPTAQVNSYSIKIVMEGGATATCSGTGPIVLDQTGADYYFTIPLGSTLAANKYFQVYLTVTTAGPSAKDVVASTFGIRSNLAPAGIVLPVKFAGFEASGNGKTTNLTWQVGVEQNLNGYGVERSSDGSSYSQIGFVPAAGKSSYYFVDVNPSATSYYRLKSVDIDGKYGYSSVVVVKAGGAASVMMKAFPSPVISKVVVQHSTADAGSNLTISTADGRMFKSLSPVVGTQQTEIDLSSAKAGLYLVRYSTPAGEVATIKVIKQ